MKYHGKEIQPLSRMDMAVVEIIEHDSKRYGGFLYHLILSFTMAGDKIDLFRVAFPDEVASFERWKSGESGYVYDMSEPAKSHLRIVK